MVTYIILFKVNYIGTLENGTEFDSNTDKSTAFTFELGAGEVIKGIIIKFNN